MKPILRGAAATLAASVVMAGLAAAALALLDLPMTLVPAVLTAAAGAPAGLASEIQTPFLPIALHGTVDVVPLGIAGPGVVVFCAVFVGSFRTPLRSLALRAAGAAATAVVLLAVLTRAEGATIDVPLPRSQAPMPTSAELTIEPGSALLTGLLAVLALAAGCALLTRLPYRRTITVTTLVGLFVPVLIGLVVAVVVATRQPAIGGVALMFGANAVLAAFGASSLTSLGGALSQALNTAAGRDGWLLGASAPTAIQATAVALLLLLSAAALVLTAPRPATASPAVAPRRGGYRAGTLPAHAGVQALVAGTTLAATLTLTTLLTAGELDLAISLAIFRTPLLALRLEPALGRALLVGALTGALAGAVGALTSDIRWRAQQRLLRRIRAYG